MRKMGEAEDVGYQVVEYLEGTNGVYEAQDPISYSGLTDTEVTPKPVEHEGYEKPEGKDRDGTGRRNNRGQILLPTERVPSYLPDGRKRRDGRK